MAMSAFGVGLGLCLLFGGLIVSPQVGLAEREQTGPPRRSPVLPPAVPPGVPEEWALWSYLDKIGPLWGRDWPTVIRFLEEFVTRYPANPVATEKLYAAYLEDGKQLLLSGDRAGAGERYQQAGQLDPNRGEAWTLLDELEALP